MTTIITEKELREMEKVLPEDAARYLGSAWTAERIRRCAQLDRCPFCLTFQNPGSKRHIYIINVERLIKYKKGEIWLAA